MHITTEQLMDLLTTAATIGRNELEFVTTRGDITGTIEARMRPEIEKITKPSAGYGERMDLAFADVLTNTEAAAVDYDASLDSDSDHVTIRRSVTKCAHRRKDQVLLWEEDAVRVPRRDVHRLISELVQALTIV